MDQLFFTMIDLILNIIVITNNISDNSNIYIASRLGSSIGVLLFLIASNVIKKFDMSKIKKNLLIIIYGVFVVLNCVI